MSLPRLAVAELCDGEQLPALLSGLENVRCDTAAAAEGQADKVGAGEGLERGEGMPTNPFLSMARGLGESCRMPGAHIRPPPAPCPVSPRVPQGLSAFPSSVENTYGGWMLHFPQGSQGLVYASSEGSLRASHGGPRGCVWAHCLALGPSPVAAQLLRSCLATGAGTVPEGAGNSRQSQGALLCHVSPHQQPPWKRLCSLLPFWVLHDAGWAAGSPRLFGSSFTGAGVKLRNVGFSLADVLWCSLLSRSWCASQRQGSALGLLH